MAKSAPHDMPRARKVKTGCITCKIRKVKCDEHKPSCQRCLSTGRKCDGYGIWDQPITTPSNVQSHRGVTDEPGELKLSCISSDLLRGTLRDRQCLEWFQCRTVRKLPGTFQSPFWDKLLLQASISERVVLHAVLALGSVSKDGVFVGTEPGRTDELSRREEQMTTQHYLKAIDHLKERFNDKDQHSIRVILIACIAFVSLDFFRGHFEAGQCHLKAGMLILHQNCPAPQIGGAFGSTDDDWILEIFTRLDLMVKLYRPSSVPSPSGAQLESMWKGMAFSSFHDLKTAWKELEKLLNQALDLSAQSRVWESSASLILPPQTQVLLEGQRQTERDLYKWLDAYRKYVDSATTQTPPQMQKVHHILYAYHQMALIMTRRSLRPRDEMAFDNDTALFLQILHHMSTLRTIIPAHYEKLDEDGLKNQHEFLSDLGWIAPLFYTAVHCRHHRIRLHAVRLLESSFHREGIWDSVITAFVARKIMTMEERGFYGDSLVHEDFDMTAVPLPFDLSLPTIPKRHRLCNVDVLLSGSPMDEVHLFMDREVNGKYQKGLLSIYRVYTRSWLDCT